MSSNNQFSRRRFLKTSLASLGALTTSNGLAAQLQLANAMTAQSTSRFTDYKAIVCIFLYGGNDSFNLLIPNASNQYHDYARTRQSLALPLNELIHLQQDDVMSLGVPQSAAALGELFNNGRASIVSNMGPMIAPASKSDLLNNTRLQPPQLFSHNDQQTLWQSGLADTNIALGWGGRMADLVMDPHTSLPLSFSLGGTNLFQRGRLAQQYAMNKDGIEQFGALDPQHEWNNTRIEHYLRVLDAADDPFTRTYAQQLKNVRSNNTILNTSLASASQTDINYRSAGNLGEQLKMIARMIEAQGALNQPRQIFFASLGGFDTHDNQVVLLPRLQEQLTHALAGFDADLQARGMAQNVVTFTQSEFGRTLTSNGDGTDHGWAGHQIIMGDAINGGCVFGHMPEQIINTNDDLGDGRMIPTTSIDQFGAQIAQWFGLGHSEINDVFPNLTRFGAADFSLFG